MRLRRAILGMGQVWRSRPPFWCDAVSGLVTVAWGLRVALMQGDLVDRTAYAPLARIASDETWCIYGLVAGVLQIVALCMDDRARWLLAVALLALWLLLADGVGHGSPGTPTLVPYLGIAALNAIPVLWLGPRLLRRLWQ